MRRSFFTILAAITLFAFLSLPGATQQSEESAPAENPQAMNWPRIVEIATALDESVTVNGFQLRLTIADVQVMVVADPVRNRMRAFVPIKSLDGVGQQEIYRLMQANFDSALDARYAVAQGFVLAVFIHPLAELQKDQLISGIGQTVNLALTYGTTFTSGALTYGGGDSNRLHERLIEELLKKGEEI